MHILFNEQTIYEKRTKTVKILLEFVGLAMMAFCFNDEVRNNVHHRDRRQSLHCSKDRGKQAYLNNSNNRDKRDRDGVRDNYVTMRHLKNTLTKSKGDNYILSPYKLFVSFKKRNNYYSMHYLLI